MDLSTITGLLLGGTCVAVALVLGGSFGAYVDPVALLIVIGGAGAATLTSVPIRQFFRVHRVSLKTLMHRCSTPQEQIARLVRLSEIARREGVLALEGAVQEIEGDCTFEIDRTCVGLTEEDCGTKGDTCKWSTMDVDPACVPTSSYDTNPDNANTP